MSATRSPILSCLTRLPSAPPLAAQLLDLVPVGALDSESGRALLERDPALTLRLLELANARAKCDSLSSALTILSPTTVRAVVLGVQLVPTQEPSGLDLGEYWRSAWCRAVAARALARHFAPSWVEAAFTAGLLESVEGLFADVQSGEEDHERRSTTEILSTCGLPPWLCTAVEASRSLGDTWTRLEDPAAAALAPVLFLARHFGSPHRESAASLRTLLRETMGQDPDRPSLADEISREVRREFSRGASSLDAARGSPAAVQEVREAASHYLQQLALGTSIDLLHLHQRLEEAGARATRLSQHNEELEKLATQDGLTQLANRFHLDRQMERMFDADLGPRELVGVVMIDLDHFKQVNDQHGHDSGDLVLCQVAEVLRGIEERERRCIAGRFGGEEFCVLTRGLTATEVQVLGEDIRERIASEGVPLQSGVVLHPTASIGIALGERASAKSGTFLQSLADQQLYQAKRAGRNQVCYQWVGALSEQPA